MFLNSKLCTLILITLSFYSVAYAQNSNELITEVDDRVLYSTEYFIRYAPQTATDMVLQIPGFTLIGSGRNGGNQNQVRGLGQGVGNLLINGKRPSTKDNNSVELLNRIPAENVIRLEILNQGSSELSGQSGQIVNVVVADSEKGLGTWDVQVHELESGITKPRFEASWASKIKDYNYTVGINLFSNEFPQWGVEKAYDENSSLFELRDEYQSFYNKGATVDLGLSWNGDNDSSTNLSFSGTSVESTFFEISDRYLPDAAFELGQLTRNVDFDFSEEEVNYELGGDHSFSFGDGTLKIIGLRRYEDSDTSSVFNSSPINDERYTFATDGRAIETENVLRTIYSVTPKTDHSLELALELVDNELDTTSIFSERRGRGARFQRIDLPGSDIIVSEERAEFSIQYSRPFAQNWTLQTLGATEYSKITVEDELQSSSDSFTRYKGFISLSGPLSEKMLLRSRIERTVGQLNFFDFASSQNVNEGTVQGGNTSLVPDQTWRAELALEYKFSDTDVATITVFHEQVDDFITLIPLGNGSEARGNIDNLKSNGIELTATIATDKFGISGGKFDFSLKLREDKILDPVTNLERDVRSHGYTPVDYQFDFRQDVPDTNIAWGATLIERSSNINYRINQINYRDHKWPQAHVLFIEHKNIAGMTLKLEIEDFLGFTYLNRREFFDGDRNGALTGFEENSRHSPWIARLGLSGSF